MIEDNFYIDMIDGNLAIEQGQEESWKVDNDSKADWCLEKIKAENAQFRRLECLINNKISYLQEELRRAQEKKDKAVQFFTQKLEEYFRTIPNYELKVTKTQRSYKLASGTLKVKVQQPEFVRDDESLLKWLKDNNMTDFIQTKEFPKWADLKKKATIFPLTSENRLVALYVDTGQVIEGVTVQEREPKFEVEV